MAENACGESVAALVVIAHAARAARNRRLERAARKRLAKRYGVVLRFVDASETEAGR